MRSMKSVKQEFLKKWIWGLRKYSSEKKNMSLLERKKAIKLSADLAMASTRNKSTRWSRALIANASRDGNNKVLLTEHVSQQSVTRRKSFTRIRSCRNMMRRINRTAVHRTKDRVVESFVGKRLQVLKSSTRRLKSLLPGGESMDDDVSLVEETLDYIQSLRAQVEVMRCLVTASERVILAK